MTSNKHCRAAVWLLITARCRGLKKEQNIQVSDIIIIIIIIIIIAENTISQHILSWYFSEDANMLN